MTGYWLLEGAGYWLSLAIASNVTVWAVMTTYNPGVAFLAFSVTVILCLLLNHSVMKALGMPDGEESEERRNVNVLGFLLAMVVSAVVVAPAVYFIVA